MFKKIYLLSLFLLSESWLFAAQAPIVPKEPLFPYLEIWYEPIIFCMYFSFGSYFLIPNLITIFAGTIGILSAVAAFPLVLWAGLLLLMLGLCLFPWAYRKEEESPKRREYAPTDESGMFWGGFFWQLTAWSLIGLLWGLLLALVWLWGIALAVLVIIFFLLVMTFEDY